MIFLDTSALVALHVQKEAGHAAVTAAWSAVSKRGRMSTSNLVMAETGSLIGRRAGCGFAADVLDRYYRSHDLEILRPTPEEDMAAIQLMRKYADQRIGMVDCVSFILMKNRGIRRALTLDEHFAIFGFEVVPSIKPAGR